MLRKFEAKDLAQPERALRDIVALSTLPALWVGADALRVAESLAAALFTTVGAPLVYVCLRPGNGQGPVSVAQINRYSADHELAARLDESIGAWVRAHDPDDLMSLPHPAGAGTLLISAQPLGFDASLGVVAAGFAAPEAPSALQHTLLSIGATQAVLAVQNTQLLASLRASIAERERAEDTLREADRRKDEFIATLSHELRNPLAALTNAVQLLRVIGGADPALAPVRELMERQMGHLVRLVDDLLEISRITRGTLELRKERVPVEAIVRAAREAAEPLFKAARHELSVSLPGEPLWVDGDPVRLAQILANLLNNAAKYTPNEGAISVRVLREGDSAVLAVRDNGVGLAPEVIPRLFQMFARGSVSERMARQGLGVGLALARRLAEMHGGTLEARSDGPGRGAEFTLRLPLAPGAGAARATAHASRSGLAAQRILVVDDNADAANSLAALLGMLGAEVRIAADGPAALEAFARERPQVVVLDIGLPGMDGYEVARAMRRTSAGAAARIIALTGWGKDEDRQRAREAGIDHHLTKPADLEALRALLEAEPAPHAGAL